jgi:hypothetical protein
MGALIVVSARRKQRRVRCVWRESSAPAPHSVPRPNKPVIMRERRTICKFDVVTMPQDAGHYCYLSLDRNRIEGTVRLRVTLSDAKSLLT